MVGAGDAVGVGDVVGDGLADGLDDGDTVGATVGVTVGVGAGGSGAIRVTIGDARGTRAKSALLF
jgi:hypothetical protein